MILELISFSLDIKNIETRSGRMQSAANTQWHIPLQKVGNFFKIIHNKTVYSRLQQSRRIVWTGILRL